MEENQDSAYPNRDASRSPLSDQDEHTIRMGGT